MSPYASHRMLTEALDDGIASERDLGIRLGLEWADVADKIVVYEDFGISKGMKLALEEHYKAGREVEYRTLGWEKR